MTFEIKAIRYTREAFLARVQSLTWKRGWRPARICLHNTGSPDIAQGLKTPEADREAVFQHYYKSMSWHSGPHLTVWHDAIWELCDLEQDGVHASCFNRGALTSIGIEMLGDFSPGRDDFNAGPGAQIRDNAVFAMAALYRQMWGHPADLLFHRDCKADHHQCPGLNVDKRDVIARVEAEMARQSDGDRLATAPQIPATALASAPKPNFVPIKVGDVAGLQRALNRLGAHPLLDIDGDLGPLTKRAAALFQHTHNVPDEAVGGPRTVAAINAALSKLDAAQKSTSV